MAAESSRKPRARRVLRIAVLALLVLAAIPLVLSVLYNFINPVSTPMLGRWLTGQRVERTWVPLSSIARVLPQTVIAAEDGRYCTHYGVDFAELREVIEDAEDLSEVRGASGIVQQTAKNLFLWNSRSFVRKALEMPLALWLDLVLSKPRLMEIYLNVAEWGPNGEFGAEAGARHAFGKAARGLSGHEAALMAAILPNPVRRSARRPGPGVQRLAGIYRGRAGGADAGCLGR